MPESLKTSIVRSLFFSKTQSIAGIARSTKKSIPLVTKHVFDLINQNLITEFGLRASTGGRRAMNYRLNESAFGCLIAVAIDQHITEVAASDILNQNIVPAHRIDLDLIDAADAFDKIADAIQHTLDQLQGKEVLAIGITMPGFVNSKTGFNNSYKATNKLHMLCSSIEKKFGITTYIENDSSAIAIVEKSFGAARAAADALIINLNWGVGLGMIIQNELFRGHSGVAGEFSHIPLADESKLCSCGKKGCLEVEASLACAMEYIQEAIASGERSSLETIVNSGQLLTIQDMVSASQHGDQVTIKAMKRIAKMLGKGIATLIHILNPEIIVISGRGAAFGAILLPEIQSAVQEFCIPRLAEHTQIVISPLENVQLLASASIIIKQMKGQSHLS